MVGNGDVSVLPTPGRWMQGMLDKAQQLNTSAREVFEFTARCCSTTTSRFHGGGNSSVDTRDGSNDNGGNGENSRPSSPVINNSVVPFSLSDGELNEGEALLFKIRRCTSAPTNPDDRATKPKSRSTVHPGVRHRVEVRCRVAPRREVRHGRIALFCILR